VAEEALTAMVAMRARAAVPRRAPAATSEAARDYRCPVCRGMGSVQRAGRRVDTQCFSCGYWFASLRRRPIPDDVYARIPRYRCPLCQGRCRERRRGRFDAYCGSCDWWFSAVKAPRRPDEPDPDDAHEALARFRNWVRIAIGLDPISGG
jgi:hypothetical protein